MSVLINRKQDRLAGREAVTSVPLLSPGGHGAHYEEAPPCDSSVSQSPWNRAAHRSHATTVESTHGMP